MNAGLFFPFKDDRFGIAVFVLAWDANLPLDLASLSLVPTLTTKTRIPYVSLLLLIVGGVMNIYVPVAVGNADLPG